MAINLENYFLLSKVTFVYCVPTIQIYSKFLRFEFLLEHIRQVSSFVYLKQPIALLNTKSVSVSKQIRRKI